MITDLKGRKIPERYLSGLGAEDRQQRIRELTASRDAYTRGRYLELPSDEKARRLGVGKTSAYTETAQDRGIEWRGDVGEMAERVLQYYGGRAVDRKRVSDILDSVFRKGLAAYYSGGHRPGQTAHSWAAARVASFVVGGKAAHTADRKEFGELPPALQQGILRQITPRIQAKVRENPKKPPHSRLENVETFAQASSLYESLGEDLMKERDRAWRREAREVRKLLLQRFGDSVRGKDLTGRRRFVTVPKPEILEPPYAMAVFLSPEDGEVVRVGKL